MVPESTAYNRARISSSKSGLRCTRRAGLPTLNLYRLPTTLHRGWHTLSQV